MKNRKPLLLLAFLATLLALPLAATAQQARNPDEILHNPRALARFLKLTPEQVTAAQALQTSLKATLEPLRAAEKQLREALQTELDAASPNACRVGDALLAVKANGERIKAAVENYDDQFSALLTPEQLRRYEALKEAARLLGGRE